MAQRIVGIIAEDDQQAHTPGPWLAAAKPSSVVGWPIVATGNGRSICSVTYVQHSKIDVPVEGDRSFNSESKANAHLIAAAPEMYEALKAVWSYLAFRDSGEPFKQVTDALAKAEGRS